MFEVNISKLRINTKIGVSSKERKNFQPLIVNLKFQYKLNKDKDLNNIDNLKDYSEIIKFLKKFISSSRYKTLEKLLDECINNLKKRYKIKGIVLTIDKKKIAKKYGCESISVSK